MAKKLLPSQYMYAYGHFSPSFFVTVYWIVAIFEQRFLLDNSNEWIWFSRYELSTLRPNSGIAARPLLPRFEVCWCRAVGKSPKMLGFVRNSTACPTAPYLLISTLASSTGLATIFSAFYASKLFNSGNWFCVFVWLKRWQDFYFLCSLWKSMWPYCFFWWCHFKFIWFTVEAWRNCN